MITLLIGIMLSTTVSLLAYLKKSLNLSGFIMATTIGTLIYYYGSYIAWTLLIAFFVSSSLISKFKEEQKKINSTTNKGSKRDYIQVLANGLLPLIFSLFYYFTNNELFLVGVAISIATSNSDTWASELGILSKGNTYSIVNFKLIKKGLSGGISLFGTFASFLGSLFIGIIFVLIVMTTPHYTLSNIVLYFNLITFGGFIGCLLDSYLGATIQAKYKCLICHKETEHLIHHNLTTELISGFKIITNDLVNFLSAAITSTLIIWIII